ncbi:Restriction endonuclease [Candidatus Defluviicoccus seviourii]|uniref:Restriction endonuclease n=2 Tax=root TaxID=1 RepID=A0A564WE62_9PROT|nr:Restriction endonuclease [uncultured Defluviicoccus sp.]VUX46268.1 Restriction endonuclease [Candidatus Defluviicoccus seviourii]
MRLWLVRSGRYGEREQEALASNVLAPGFVDIGDLSKAASKDDVREVLRGALPDAGDGRIKHFTNQLYQFVRTMSVGDLAIMPRKNTGMVAIAEVRGDYAFRPDLPNLVHVRPVKWLRPDVSRDVFEQDLTYSLGAFMTICEISRNNAVERVKAVVRTGTDPGPVRAAAPGRTAADIEAGESAIQDIDELARDQIRKHIGAKFKGHALARLVAAVLEAEGYVTSVSSPGKDGGVDILAGRGSLGLDPPRLCVQVKSGSETSDVTVLRALQGTMQNVKADHGLLVSWSGVTQDVEREARQSYFTVRIWRSSNLIEAALRNYERLSEEIRNDLPLKRTWTLVLEE